MGFTSSTYDQKPGPGWTGNSVAGDAILRTPGLGANAGHVELRWKAPKKGVVKVVSRTWSKNGFAQPTDPTRDVWHEIWRYPAAGGMELKRTDYVTDDDPNGPIIVERIEVEINDEIRLRVRRNWDGSLPIPPDAVFAWKPAIVYEGKSITYRLGNSLPDIPDTQTEHFIEVQVTPSGPVTVGPLDAGNKFIELFKTVPRAPLEVRLMAESSTTGVTFDDVACHVVFDDISEAGLRQEILDEVQWSRENVLGQNNNGHNNSGVLDDGTNNQGQTLGLIATPYAVHRLDIVGGTDFVTAAIAQDAPGGLWPYLSRHYDGTDYKHFYQIREMEVFQNLSPVGLIYFKYDAVADTYLNSFQSYDNGVEGVFLIPDFTTPSPRGLTFSGVPDLLTQYQRTNDITYLELAMAYSLVIADNGAITQDTSLAPFNSDTRVGILADKQYHIDTGAQLISPLEADQVFGGGPRWEGKLAHLRATSALVQTYAAARIYNKSIEPAPAKFSDADLIKIRDACNLSILEAKDVLDPVAIGSAWRPLEDDWHGIVGLFQDNFGNQAIDAVAAVLAMNAYEQVDPFLPMSPDVSIRDTLRDVWLKNGIKRYYELWAQAVARYELNAGDQVRGWMPIHEVLAKGIPNVLDPTDPELPTEAELEEQFRLAALNALKYQFADRPGPNQRSGFWTSGGLGDYQLLNLGIGFGGKVGAAASYVEGLGLAYSLLEPQQGQEHPDRPYIRAALLAMLRGNQTHLKAQVTQPAGEGYGYWQSVYNQVLALKMPPCQTLPPCALQGPAEQRALDPLLAAFDQMPPQPPTGTPTETNIEVGDPSISPESYGQSGSQKYTFTLAWNHAMVDEAVMQDAWENRTQVTRWRETVNGWEPTELSMLKSFTQTGSTSNTITYETVLSYPKPPSGERSKFTIRTWGNYEQWKRDTSVQATD